ncbi:MAG: Phospholipid ABC transporter permease protein MlaE [Candidatus Rifleibacterium amylolyticum]|nr:MAG: Phospholipid ABC transporter permease protein MlaE [Candidatus Rifleibacterium amylolyticum]NLF95532.1 ABC transporter permease [Candidatus Riflebacteria bacterium]
MISYLEKMVKDTLDAVGNVSILFLQTIYWTFHNLRTGRFAFGNLIEQMSRIGVDSLLMVAITGVSTGAVLVVQIGYQFAQMGAQSYVGGVVALSMARELAPILTSIVVAGRVGSAIAAELGTMKITEQIDALETMATNPVEYLVVPRFWGCTIMLFMLTIFTNVVGMIGGSIVAVNQIGLTLISFKDSILHMLQIQDLMGGLIKATVFGSIIGVIGCYKGFTTEGGAEGVGQSTTSAVVVSIMLILAVNYFLTVGINNFCVAYLQ